MWPITLLHLEYIRLIYFKKVYILEILQFQISDATLGTNHLHPLHLSIFANWTTQINGYLVNLIYITLHSLFFLFGIYGPSINLKVGRKREIPKKNHLTTRKQNLACLTWPGLGSNQQRWDDKWFRALKISILNHFYSLYVTPLWRSHLCQWVKKISS